MTNDEADLLTNRIIDETELEVVSGITLFRQPTEAECSMIRYAAGVAMKHTIRLMRNGIIVGALFATQFNPSTYWQNPQPPPSVYQPLQPQPQQFTIFNPNAATLGVTTCNGFNCTYNQLNPRPAPNYFDDSNYR